MKRLPLWLFVFPIVTGAQLPDFTRVQPELFSAPGAQSNAWGDYDNDGDLDLIVSIRNAPVRLYRNDAGMFTDVAAAMGLPEDGGNPRGIAWGDYDSDGDLDLYIGYASRSDPPNRLFRNDGDRFVDVAADVGAALKGITGQVAFVDYDSDGDVDLYVAFRETFNRMLRNEGGQFEDVSFASGLAEIRRTVGACWFDMDADGDLDLFTANQNGDRDGFFRNDGGRFTDVAMELEMDQPRRPVAEGSVGCAVTDYDSDGDLDLYVAEYGHDSLYRNEGNGRFTDVAAGVGVAVVDHIVTGAWGDVNNDGRPDLYTVGYVNRQPGAKDYLFLNGGDSFTDVLPPIIGQHDADHGVQWADYDQDGDLDLALAANDPTGAHALFRNDSPQEVRQRSLQVLVLDQHGRYTKAGSEVRIYRAGSRELLGLRLVDTGTGYKTQNAMPVHFGLPRLIPVDVEITSMSPSGQRTDSVKNVDPAAFNGRPLVVRARASSEREQVPTAHQSIKDCSHCPELVVVPPGDFRMGTPENVPVDNETGESPPVDMRIPRAFALGKFEVTVAEFETYAQATGFEPTVRCRVWSDAKGRYDDDDNRSWRRPGVPEKPQPNHPVSCVSWEDAQGYVRWLAQETGLPYRLPTEAEWEYGARAGSAALYPWGDDPHQGCRFVNAYDQTTERRYPLAWEPMACADGFEGVAPVGSLAPNAFGLYDMLGNVWEFAEDCATRSHAGRPKDGSAWVWEGGCARRIQRGGGWITSIARIRPGYHGDANATHRFDFGGFRVARDLSDEELPQ